MSVKSRLRTLACCGILEMAAVIGVPMRPEQIQDLMRTLNEPKIARTNPDDSNRGDGLKTDDSRVPPPAPK
ncbi:hypothetical protein EHM76_05795 [bacterium]|nr:MAG: hypothetical protein EHM76_05795 [bacterium]